ncbi:MAG: energy transducer TonB [Candidatus Acidiferrum sp.]
MNFARIILSVAILTVALSGASGQQASEVLPKILQHAEPIYPPLAAQTRITGDVHIEFTTDGESVRDVLVESGHPLLRAAAENNLRTWKFASHLPGKFQVTFRYRIAPGGTEVTFPESPPVVQIETTPPMVTDFPCSSTFDIGMWKTRLSSSHGVVSQLLELSSYCEKSLDGTATGPESIKEKIEFGHYEDPFLTFTMNVHQPDGRTTKTFFVGKISRYKIVGTFVDNVGITGEWTAVRLANKPKS